MTGLENYLKIPILYALLILLVIFLVFVHKNLHILKGRGDNEVALSFKTTLRTHICDRIVESEN